MELTDKKLDTTYSAISVKMSYERMEAYYLLTLIIPILALTVLSPTGLILPGTLCLTHDLIEHSIQLTRVKNLVS